MLNRRKTLMLLSGTAVTPKIAFAATPREITWEDLLPPGLPYSEIVDMGEMDWENDVWTPIYDANAIKLNEELNGAYIKMPGFIIPFETSAEGVTNFMLVPYLGACIHTPPPPANQLVMVDTAQPWPGDQLWDPVWVTGTMSTQLQSTSLGQTGYSIEADDMEVYEW
ncbi:DUF3299 domain-containing protein [Falsihalocynthiibacter arcticus]|uniref:DUF3299 domain-containing protein n=1 Tax=Falsihalocynthiibacter arcticus TaxID=1579316 RepID=A0A126V1D9_9RHOB|nr:DUF3299 domain-containing protein [Falsihalocynthiibacter arcticus]AML51977.1 hypothetical protein RC74_12485 [Falsihalocynthiibacter arcticus]